MKLPVHVEMRKPLSVNINIGGVYHEEIYTTHKIFAVFLTFLTFLRSLAFALIVTHGLSGVLSTCGASVIASDGFVGGYIR